MSANGISTLATKQLRQVAKLDIAQAKRQGKTVAIDGTITGTTDPTKPYYRLLNTYDLTLLPDTYNNNVPGADDNPNTGGLVESRPWGLGVVEAPLTLSDAVPTSVLVDLESWYDGSDSTSFIPSNPADGATFTQWTDKSAFAHNANPVGGATTRATYQVNEQNALSVIRFDGNDGLSINPYASLASAVDLTIFVVMKMTATTGDPATFVTNSGATGLIYDSTAGKFVVKAAGGTGVSTVVNNATGFHIHSFAYDGTQTGNANRLKYRYDKSDITLAFSGTVGATLSASNTTLYIGNNNGANFYTGDMAELLIFTHALSPIEIQNVENYLGTKWGL